MGKYDKFKNMRDAVSLRDEEIKKNQEAWRAADERGDEEGKRLAHSAQVDTIKEFDAYSGGVSTFDEGTGEWSLSDGKRTKNEGAEGNSIYNPYYSYAAADGAKEYSDAERAYKGNTFSYAPESDPAYRAYRKEYENLGRFAMDDTLARAAARTGGSASSYAVSAAAAAYNKYMDAAADKIPELRELAYEKYKDEKARYLEIMDIAKERMERDEAEYNKNRGVYLDAAENEKQSEARLSSALIKAQTEGFGSLSSSEREAIYKSGAYYDPSDNTIVASDGMHYALAKEEGKEEKETKEEKERKATTVKSETVSTVKADDGTAAQTALLKFQYKGTGFSALSGTDIKALTAAGYTYNGTGWVSPAGEVINPVLKASTSTAKSSSGAKSSSSAKSASGKKSTSGTSKAAKAEEEKKKEQSKTAEELRKENGTVEIGGVKFTKRKSSKRATV